MTTGRSAALPRGPRWAWLPPIGSTRYYLMLGLLGSLVLGPLGGVTAAYMNFSIGFFVGGQVLAGILGSTVTLGYGPDGKHGANYMQTAAASVAGMAAMSVLLQAMVWMGLPQPPVWQLILFMGATGMFGAGVGMLYTPILVDRLQLTFPSGLAVANILRALTDPVLLRLSMVRLGAGVGAGLLGGWGSAKWAWLGAIELSTSTLGAGLLVGARIGLPALLAGLAFSALTPWFTSIDWLQPGDPFRKIAFLMGLGMIMGAALLDIGQILREGWQRWRAPRADANADADADVAPPAHRPPLRLGRLLAWTFGWAGVVVWLSASMLQQPVFFMAIAVALVFVFALVNGISLGISDSAPISSAFVTAIVLMAVLGLKEPTVGLIAGGILLVACSVAADMQQDRSTGWRLGTNRIIQFRYQVLGVFMGAVLCVLLAKVFMAAFPELLHNQYKQPLEGTKWQSAMTFKFVGALEGLTHPSNVFSKALMLGVAIGFATELLRKIIKKSAGYKAFVARGKLGFATDFAVDAIVLPSPYASSFGGFVDFLTALWFALGGILTSFGQMLQNEVKAGAKAAGADDVPEDMSTTALVGGGLIAGDSLAALAIGIYGLVSTLAG